MWVFGDLGRLGAAYWQQQRSVHRSRALNVDIA